METNKQESNGSYHQVKAVIFDLDGTLLDTLDDIADSVNRVLRAQGFPTHKREAFRFFVGDGSLTLIKRALPENERSNESVERCLSAFKKDYANTWDVKTKPYAGIPELLNHLMQTDVRMAVCSNKPHVFTTLCVDKLLDRWRFDQVVGQKPVVKTLQNSLKRGRVAHALLFSGVRGVGKTTLARLMAKSLNCLDGPTALPCNECRSCKEISAGSALDLLEIDGASNRGIQEVRELKDKIKYMPTSSRYKIVIIDEVTVVMKQRRCDQRIPCPRLPRQLGTLQRILKLRHGFAAIHCIALSGEVLENLIDDIQEKPPSNTGAAPT